MSRSGPRCLLRQAVRWPGRCIPGSDEDGCCAILRAVALRHKPSAASCRGRLSGRQQVYSGQPQPFSGLFRRPARQNGTDSLRALHMKLHRPLPSSSSPFSPSPSIDNTQSGHPIIESPTKFMPIPASLVPPVLPCVPAQPA